MEKEKLFIKKIEEQLNIFQNFPVIMEKALRDGYIQKIYNTINSIFSDEMKFAYQGKFKKS
jgi:hypothetical protein